MGTFYSFYYNSPVGQLIIGEYEGRIVLCDWVEQGRRQTIDIKLKSELSVDYVEKLTPIIGKAISQLDAYFAHQLTIFDLPLMLVGTDFQKRVWRELMTIPYGNTISYRELAQRIGNPKAVRAVASACNQNRISIIIPCHRVIASSGELHGYAAGVEAKSYLINLERDECKISDI